MTSFYIHAYGYSANVADAEHMAGLLQQAKFEPAAEMKDADIVIFTTCTVKGPSETDFFSTLGQFKKEYPHKLVVITGCIPQADPQKFKQYAIVGTRNIHHIVEVVEEALHNNILHMLNNDELPPLNMPKIRKNPVVEILPINRGCLGACTFCKTKKARGTLVSYPIEEIVAVAQNALKEGVQEIWLTSQDTFCYGFDLKTDIIALLEELVKLPGDFRIRIGMGNPDHLPKLVDRLLPLYHHPKIFKFLHLPVQAGSTKVLQDMNRKYTAEYFVDIIQKFRRNIPEINIMTDMIVGYPTESEDDFWQTLEVTRKTTPDSINISRFWPRPGTPTAKLEELPGEEVKRRSRVLTDIFHNISRLQNEKWLGWRGHVIVDERSAEPGQWIARNDAYKPVIVEGNFKLGDVLNVQIVKTNLFCLEGQVQ